MGGLLAKGEVSRGAVDAHVAPGAVQTRVEHGAAQAFTRADMRVLGVQQGKCKNCKFSTNLRCFQKMQLLNLTVGG